MGKSMCKSFPEEGEGMGLSRTSGRKASRAGEGEEKKKRGKHQPGK
jgi:hypothetical protein